MKDLNNKVAVVTGAGSGIGRSLAKSLAARGCRLALSDVNEAGLAETAASLGGAEAAQRPCVRPRPPRAGRGWNAQVSRRFRAGVDGASAAGHRAELLVVGRSRICQTPRVYARKQEGAF